MEDNVKDFKKPLGQFVEEEVPVLKHNFDPNTKKIISTYELQKVKTMYVHAPKEKIRCKNGTHVFRVINIHRGLFGCKNCTFKRIVYPTTYRFDAATGALIHKITGARI